MVFLCDQHLLYVLWGMALEAGEGTVSLFRHLVRADGDRYALFSVVGACAADEADELLFRRAPVLALAGDSACGIASWRAKGPDGVGHSRLCA